MVIPAYNEADRIGPVVEAVGQAVAWPVLVIDDGSRDGTADRAREAGATVLRHGINIGYGAAVHTGIKYAYRHGCSCLVQLDADGQHDPAGLKDLLRPVVDGEADYVIGSRFLPIQGVEPYRGSLIRRVGSRVISLLVRLFTGLRITDPTSGFVAMNRAVMSVLSTEVYPHDYPDADVILMLHRRGFRIREAAVRMIPSSGKSMHGGIVRPLYYAYKMGLSILMTLLRNQSWTCP